MNYEQKRLEFQYASEQYFKHKKMDLKTYQAITQVFISTTPEPSELELRALKLIEKRNGNGGIKCQSV